MGVFQHSFFFFAQMKEDSLQEDAGPSRATDRAILFFSNIPPQDSSNAKDRLNISQSTI
jgi:hypothetical protein